MIKHTITYTDFDDNVVTKDFWFNLNEGDIFDIQMSKKQGFFELLQVAVDNEDPTIVGEAFRKILVGAVGRREGELFIKDDDARNQLIYTNAYSALIVWMLANPTEAQALINGMLPKNAQEELKKNELIQKFQAKTEEMALPEPETTAEAEVPMPTLTTETPDFSAMTPEQFEAWKNSQA